MFGAIGRVDNHLVRTGHEQVAREFPAVTSRSCRKLDGPEDQFARAFDRWCNVTSTSTDWPVSKPVPLVIVATAGGASRAAYWTDRILAELEARIPGFHNYVFAISSVSGEYPRQRSLPALA